MRRLTAKTIETLPPARDKRYEVRDALLPGLLLRVSASGSKVFYISKRVDQRVRRIKVGTWPILSLHDARELARMILRSIELGEYDREAPEEDEVRTPTLGEVIPQFIELYAKPRTRDWRGSERVLEKFSSLYDRPIDQIRRSDIVRVLDSLVAEGTPTRANRALAAIKKLMNWCIDRGTVETSPVAHLKMPTKEVARERVLGSGELRLCWEMAEAEGFPFGPCVQLLMLTGQRRGEVSEMRWSELDLDNAIWTIPGRRTKNGSTHVVPLSPLAMQIIRSVPRYLNSDFVFTTTGRTPISGFGRLKDRLDAAFGPDAEDWRIHDLRRTVATKIAMLRIGPQIIEAIQNQKSGIVSGVALKYNRHAYQDEKREALELWAERVAATVKGTVGNDGDRDQHTDIRQAAPGTPDRWPGVLRAELAGGLHRR
jgi:integrase